MASKYGYIGLVCFFLKKNCGGVPHSASFCIFIKEKTVQDKEDLQPHQGGKKDKNNKISKLLYLAIV